MNRKYLATSLSVVLTLTNGVGALGGALAKDAHPVSVEAAAFAPAGNTATPIGAVEVAGAVSINGRSLQGKDVLWDGEWLQAAPGSSAVVTLNAVGQVTLAGNTMVRLAVSNAAEDVAGETSREQKASRVMIASVLTGEVSIKLNADATGYLEAGGNSWLADSGSDLRLAVHDGALDLKAASGRVQPLGSWTLALPTIKKDGEAVAANAATNAASASDRQLLPAAPALRTVAEQQRETLRASVRRMIYHGTVVGSLAKQQPLQAVRLYATSSARMIGMVEASGKMKINGRNVRGQEMLWNGEVIQAPADASAKVSLADLGQVTLAPGATAKITTVVTRPDVITERRALAVSVLHGEVGVKLLPDAQAFVEASSQSFVASDGAQFRLRAEKEEAVLMTANGNVQPVGRWTTVLATDLLDSAAKARQSKPRQFLIRPAAGGGQTGYLSTVRPDSTQMLSFVVTDDKGKPAPGVPVAFALNAVDGKQVGKLGQGEQAGAFFETVTDANGIALVPFTAEKNTGSTSLSAAVQGEQQGQSSVVTVQKEETKFWSKRHALPVLAVAGAAVVAGIAVALSKDDRLPLKGIGDTIIVP